MQPRRQHLSEIPLLFPAMGMVVGIAVCGLLPEFHVWIWVAVAIVGILAGLGLREARVVIAVSGYIVGVAAWWISVPAVVPAGVSGMFRGEVVRNIDYGQSQRCVVDVGGDVRIAVTVYDYPYLVEKGDSVEFSGLLLPAVRLTTVPDEQDGRSFAMVNRVSAVCSPQEGDFKIVADASGIQGQLNGFRNTLLGYVKDSGLSQPAATFLAAVLLGEDNVDDGIRQLFSHAGLSHTLALSGTHVSIIVFLLVVVLFPVEMAGNRKIRISLTILAIWGYALLTGMSPSVVRAVIMATFLLVGKLSGRFSNSLNSLLGAALAILLFQPVALFQPGFQLSFLAVAGILMFMPPVQQWLIDSPWGRRRGAYLLVNAIAIPISAVLATAPLSAWHFHYFPLWFLVANLPVAVLLPLIICGGVVLLFMTAAVLPSGALVWCVDCLYGMIEKIAWAVSGLPGAGLDGNLYFSVWLLLPIYAGMFLLWLGWNRNRKAFLVNGGILLLTAVLLIPVAVPQYADRECYVWNINRGVALVCREGEDVHVVTDAALKYHPEIKELADFRLNDFLGKRDAGLKRICGDSLSVGGVDVRKDLWIVNGRHVAVLRGVDEIPAMGLGRDDILLVSAGFRGDIIALKIANPEPEMVLSPSLPPLRRKRYANELSKAGLPYSLNLPADESRYNPLVK